MMSEAVNHPGFLGNQHHPGSLENNNVTQMYQSQSNVLNRVSYESPNLQMISGPVNPPGNFNTDTVLQTSQSEPTQSNVLNRASTRLNQSNVLNWVSYACPDLQMSAEAVNPSSRLYNIGSGTDSSPSAEASVLNYRLNETSTYHNNYIISNASFSCNEINPNDVASIFSRSNARNLTNSRINKDTHGNNWALQHRYSLDNLSNDIDEVDSRISSQVFPDTSQPIESFQTEGARLTPSCLQSTNHVDILQSLAAELRNIADGFAKYRNVSQL